MQLKNPIIFPILRVEQLHKSFGHVQALRGIDLSIFGGQIIALVGDNGAGKSTLIKIISGVYSPDQGDITIAGKSYSHLTPFQALELGIATVYQDLALVDCLDVPSNIFLGREPSRAKFFVDRKKMYVKTAELLKKLEIDVPSMDVEVGNLSGGQRQATAVARAISRGGKIFIFDEPTAAMGVKESEQVMELIRGLKNRGYAVIIISHNLHQVFNLADRICIMRQGELVGDFKVEESTPDEVVKLITGVEFNTSDSCRQEVTG